MNSITSLREMGFKVRVIHRRNWTGLWGGKVRLKSKFELDKEALSIFRPEAKGGETTVQIEKDGRTITAVAECSKKDSFNKKVGVQIAIGRALKEFNRKEEAKPVTEILREAYDEHGGQSGWVQRGIDRLEKFARETPSPREPVVMDDPEAALAGTIYSGG